MIKDNVHCNNCDKDLLVQKGSDVCTLCNVEGCLSWNEPNEVEEQQVKE